LGADDGTAAASVGADEACDSWAALVGALGFTEAIKAETASGL
jgi:hypothetical protein